MEFDYEAGTVNGRKKNSFFDMQNANFEMLITKEIFTRFHIHLVEFSIIVNDY